jgi:hypothetical protein
MNHSDFLRDRENVWMCEHLDFIATIWAIFIFHKGAAYRVTRGDMFFWVRVTFYFDGMDVGKCWFL